MKTNYAFFIQLRIFHVMLDYALLSALAAVVREGSFERAARTLHVTPSAVSQRIRLLEERVGCALVVRGQPCLATETGRRLCQHVDRVRLLEHELHAGLPSLDPQELARVTLPIAVNADSLATWFAPAVTRFAADAPVLMSVAVDDQDHTPEWPSSGAVTEAVTGTATPATGRTTQPLSPTKDGLQARWVRRLCHRHVELPRHTLPSPEAFVVAALAGMGWALHPQALIADHLASGALVALVPQAPLDVPLHWQQARAASSVLEGLTRVVLAAARSALGPA